MVVIAAVVVDVPSLRKTGTLFIMTFTTVPTLEVPDVSVPSLFPVSAGTFVSILSVFLTLEVPFVSVPSLWWCCHCCCCRCWVIVIVVI